MGPIHLDGQTDLISLIYSVLLAPVHGLQLLNEVVTGVLEVLLRENESTRVNAIAVTITDVDHPEGVLVHPRLIDGNDDLLLPLRLNHPEEGRIIMTIP